MEEQIEMDFSSSDIESARQMGIRWSPNEATPEQIKEWHETENKWWSDRALSFVAIASVLQFGTLLFMMFNFWVISIMTNN